jgi:hypothetical protein
MNSTARIRSSRARVPAAILTGVLALSAVGLASGAEPPTDAPPLAAEHGSGWLATKVADDGTVSGGFDPLGDAGTAALAFAAAGVESDAYDRAVDQVVANIETFVAPYGTDDAGRLGRALLLADATGIDPTSFGGMDLIARLEATLGDFEPGLYGASDPTYDGAYRQGLAITGLIAVGEGPDPDALQWLSDQQCDGATPAALGGWQSYRADTGVACDAPDGTLFVGPDSNSTTAAIMALDAAGATPNHDALAFLESTEEADGGWAFQAGGTVDPNSTGLVISALIAVGEDPGEWGIEGARPYDSLLSWSVACGEPDEGAFSSPYSGGAGDVFASLDAIPAAAGRSWILDGPVVVAPDAAVACQESGSTTTTTADPGDGATTTTQPGGTPATTPPPATPVPQAASFAG